MYSGWNPAMSLENLGYPLVELADDGTFVITKPENTGGEVSVATVSEQLVYEIGDAEHYLTPDVDVDFSQVTLSQAGRDRVAVAGARGRPRPPRLKASLAYRDGYMATGQLVICGAGATMKARACGELILARLAAAGVKFRRTHIECLGTGDTWPGLWPGPQPESLSEVVLRVAAHADHRADLERFLREFAPLAGSGPPGVTGYTGPRAAPYPVFAYWPSTIDRQAVTPTVEVRRAADWATP